MNENVLIERIHSERQHNQGKRTFSFEYEGKKIWVKQSESAAVNIWHKIGRVLASLIHSPLFVPTVATDAHSSLEGEARRLRTYTDQGVCVPALIAHGEGWLALSDGGKPISALVRDRTVHFQTKKQVILQAVEALVQLHQKNLWHGRPALRDIAYDGNQITLIDFEEDPGAVLNPQECMVRDIFLFVHSMHYYLRDEPDILHEALQKYQKSERSDIWEQTLKLSRKMVWIYWVLKLAEPVAGKDARFAYQTLKFFLENK